MNKRQVINLLALFMVLALLLMSCGPVIEQLPVDSTTVAQTAYSHIERYVDTEAGVVCYIYSSYGISCLPLSETNLQAEYGE